MVLRHLFPTAEPEEVAAALKADGACIIDNLAGAALMDRVAEEMDPYVDLTPDGRDAFTGHRTRRTGSMIARSAASRELIMNPLVLGTTAKVLQKAATYQLHLTQLISIFPGETDQVIHRDEIAWDFFPFPSDYDAQCNTLWALTDFTAENGATRVLPGSHTLPPDALPVDALDGGPVERAEMERGSVLIYTGKVFHGASANTSDMIRQGINLTYCVGWVRQEENQYLSTPIEVARSLDDDLLRLMGYQLGALAIGYVRDFEDPMVTVRDVPKGPYNFVAHVQQSAREGAPTAEPFYHDLVKAESTLELADAPGGATRNALPLVLGPGQPPRAGAAPGASTPRGRRP
jgi:ectoine hydroxylase-related dioxygenase (phytanoyl-CoA dioxygenase family)